MADVRIFQIPSKSAVSTDEIEVQATADGASNKVTLASVLALGNTLFVQLSAVAAAVQTWLATPSSANLFSALTSKTGSGGNVVFSTGPTISGLNTTGLQTSDGASVTTANAITLSSNAGTIDHTKGLNTCSNAANTTLSFSGSPASADTWTTLIAVNTDGANARTWTIPSAFSVARQSNITSFDIPAGGRAVLFFRWNGSAWMVMGDLVPLANKGIQFGPFATGADDTQEIILAMPFAGNFVSVTTDCDSGTATYVVRNITTGVNATGSASVSSTKATQALSGTVSFSAGDTIGIVRSANSSCVNGRGTIFVAPASA